MDVSRHIFPEMLSNTDLWGVKKIFLLQKMQRLNTTVWISCSEEKLRPRNLSLLLP